MCHLQPYGSGQSVGRLKLSPFHQFVFEYFTNNVDFMTMTRYVPPEENCRSIAKHIDCPTIRAIYPL